MSAAKADTVKARKGVYAGERAAARFHVDWQACRAAYGGHAKGGYDQLRACNAVLGKLELISRLVPTEGCPTCARRPDVGNRELRTDIEAPTVLFTDEEFKKYQAMKEEPEIIWSYNLGRDLQDSVEWSRSWETVETSEATLTHG